MEIVQENFLIKGSLTNLREGDLGAVYGFQWRYFGADYNTCDTNYLGEGIRSAKKCSRNAQKR